MKEKDEAEISKAAKYKKAYRAFNRRIKTEEDAADAIFKKLKAEKKIVCQCGCMHVKRMKGSRFYSCEHCRKETHFTVGTIYEGAGKLRARLGALYFWQRKINVPPAQLATMFKIAYTTARKIFLETSIVLLDSICDQMSQSDESLVVELNGSEFEQVIARRSRETPARQHPYAEQQEIERVLWEEQNHVQNYDSEYSHVDEPADLQTDLDSLPSNVYPALESALVHGQQTDVHLRRDETEQKILDVLSDVPRSTDDLNILTSLPANVIASKLTMLQLDGLVVECAGGRFVKVEQKKNVERTQSASSGAPHLDNFITAFIWFIHKFFGKVSRKCLQLYLVRFWCWLDKSFGKKDQLLSIVLRHPPLGERAVDQFVSAPILIFPLSQMATLEAPV